MKKVIKCLVLVLILSLALSVPAFADDSEAQLAYVTDAAGLLSESEYSTLSAKAAEISRNYDCSVYIITMDDYTEYVQGDIYTCATTMFDYYSLGWGADKSGVLLMLSMAERDYTLIAHGAVGNGAFTDYGKDLLSEEFLDNFRNNDWYGGFSDYVDGCGYMLDQYAKGSPIDISGSYAEPEMGLGMKLLLILGIPCLIALVVCSVFKAQMKTAGIKTTAGDYIKMGDLRLNVQQDLFTHRTQTRQIIQQQTSRSGGGGGGTTIRSGGFSGKSGKF